MAQLSGYLADDLKVYNICLAKPALILASSDEISPASDNVAVSSPLAFPGCAESKCLKPTGAE